MPNDTPSSQANSPQQSGGGAVNKYGNEVVDPTRNVLDLVSAAIKRQDDLREADNKIADLRDAHAKELRSAEAARIDAIRAVDVGAVKSAAEVQATQASTLAQQVATSAETLRTQVAATATAAETKLAAALEPIQKDIADLRRVQYEGVGQKIQSTDTRASTSAIVGYVVGAVGLLTTFMSLIIYLTRGAS